MKYGNAFTIEEYGHQEHVSQYTANTRIRKLILEGRIYKFFDPLSKRGEPHWLYAFVEDRAAIDQQLQVELAKAKYNPPNPNNTWRKRYGGK